MIVRTNFSNGLIYVWDGKNIPFKYSNGYVSIVNNKKIISCTMSHGIRDYYLELKDVSNAWQVSTTAKSWMILRLNNFTGVLEYVSTTTNPENSFGREFPLTPTIDDTFFNLSNNRMFLWNGYNWINIIQIIVATCENGIIVPCHTGTQVASSRPSNAGSILQSKNRIPLRISDGDYYSFMTEIDYEDNINTWKNSSNILVSNSVYYGIAAEDISTFSLLSVDSNGDIVKSNNIDRICFAMSVGNFSIGQVVKFITRGEITNNSWLFTPDQINKNLFCDINGQITTVLGMSNIIQKVGTVIGRDIIDFYPQEPIYLNPSPTPTPTPSVTPIV